MEVIEAHWLFHVPLDDIQVIIHPQSIIHSMVEFPDGSVKAQISYPDMRLPIQYALSYPERLEAPVIPRIDFKQAHSLTFEAFDSQAFPCLQLAMEAGRKEGTYPAVLCAADEVAVDLFLNGRIGFLDIPRIISTTLEQHQSTSNPSLSDITQADYWAREQAHSIAAGVELQ
jgi:1-deoxy-D-xylulose-5-phosphate reductoisomerase